MDTGTTHTTPTASSPAVLYARIFGAVLTIAGIAGLAINTDQKSVESLLGLDVNLTHNIVHLASGVLGLVAGFAALAWSRMYALILGIIYTVLAVWGFTAGNTFDPFDLFVRINMADHILHLAIGVLGLAAWIASRTKTGDTGTV